MTEEDGQDPIQKEKERKIAVMLDRLKEVETYSENMKARLNRFSEEMFGFVHDEKREELAIENGYCGMIQYRIENISNVLYDISLEINKMLYELPRTQKE